METLRSKELTQPQAVCFIFFNLESDELLVEHRSDTRTTLAGDTVFPAGKIEPGESVEQAFQREIKEELGVAPKEFEFVGTFDHDLADNKQKSLHTFIITKWDGEVQNKEPSKSKLEWVKREKIHHTLTYVQSSYLYLLSIAKIGLIDAKEFHRAPEIKPMK